MNQSHRFRKGTCIFCGAKIDILQEYNTHLSVYVDVSIPVCPKCNIKEIKYIDMGVYVR